MSFTLRPHQIAAADAVEHALVQGIRRPLVNMCVAAGKSITYAELARRALARGQRTIIGAHVRELVEQNADACLQIMPGGEIGVNAASLDRRDWRLPITSVAIQSVFRHGRRFGPVDFLICDECHLLPHSETGMYLEFWRSLGEPTLIGGSGTTFRLQGGSLVEGEGAPFDREVYVYSILDGIRDGYLVPPVSLATEDNMDPSKLKTRSGEYTGESQDEQMITAMDNHIAQMIYHGQDRRGWLIFEASAKAAKAMCERMNQWGIPTGLVLGTTPDAERRNTVEAYRQQQLRALVNVNALCLDEDTEILTSEGFVGIDHMTMDHRIAAWKENETIEFTAPKLIVVRARQPNERMIRIGGELTPRIRVTANHRMVVRCGGGLRHIKTVSADELLSPVWKTIPTCGIGKPDLIFVPTPKPKCDQKTQVRINAFNYRKRGIPADEAQRMAEEHADRIRTMRYRHPYELTLDECSLIGFWLGDGTKSCKRVSLSQSNRYPDNIKWIDELLGRLGIAHSRGDYSADRPTAFSSVRWTLARGTGGHNQTVSKGYFEIEPYLEKNGTYLFRALSRPQLDALLQGLWRADGLHHSKKPRSMVAGTQKELYQLLQEICSMRGISATVIACSAPRKSNHRQQYKFAWGGRTSWRINGKNAIEEKEFKKERVWCVTSSTSYLICRRQGKVFVTGNTTGFNVPHTDMEVMRRRTKSLGFYIQMIGRVIRTIGGHIDISRTYGKVDGAVLDFAGNIDQHGPLDCIRPIASKARFILCDECGCRNGSAATRCRSCDAVLTKNCPACLTAIQRGLLDCPNCGFDMRVDVVAEPKSKLLDRPSGAALLSSHRKGIPRQGGWIPIRSAWESNGIHILDDTDGNRWELPAALAPHAASARWVRPPPNLALLLPNGGARSSACQVMASGQQMLIPLPPPVL